MPLSSEDWIEIANLCGRYCSALDASDGDRLAALFTEDGVCEIPERTFTGPRELNQMAANKDRSKWRHLSGSLFIEGDGDSAKGTSYVAVVVGPKDRGFVVSAFGTYDDEFVKVNGRWLFKRRNIIRPHTDEFDSVTA